MRLSSRVFKAVPTVVVLATLVATPAHAQLGALRRAAERRVEQKAEERVQAATLIPPTFDATTVEITSERLDRYLAAMTKLKAERAANRARFEAVDRQRQATQDSAGTLENDAGYKAYNAAADRYDDCRSTAKNEMDEASSRSMQALAARMQANPVAAQNDPKVKAMVAVMQEMAAAQQSGDSVAFRKAMERASSLTGTPYDSASIDRAVVPKCGARPTRPAVVVRHDALVQRTDSLKKVADGLSGTSGGVKGADVGMTDAQSRMMWERIQSWLNGVQDSAPITRTFTKAEFDLLTSRRSDIRKAFSGSE